MDYTKIIAENEKLKTKARAFDIIKNQNEKLKSELMSLKELLHCDIPKMKREQDMKEAYWLCWSSYVDPKDEKMPDKEFVDSWCEDPENGRLLFKAYQDNNLLKDMDDLKSYLYGEFMLDEEEEEEEQEWDPNEYGNCKCCGISLTEDDFNNGTGRCESCDDVDLEKFD